ncbi:MAG TPA: hypothetical protein VFB06_26995 [Streptosporangiaceae bacterium]|nr:hypothetical protein [Streptosporangiaceae bacterium]
MASDAVGVLDEAYQRMHATGPEYEGWLSNHGPMAAEAMARHGHGDAVGRWLDGYVKRLEEFPRGSGPIGADWRGALGDPKRIADWTVYFNQEMTERPWRQVLGEWWSRLLPGSAAAATHGIIRVGHAIRALQADGDDPVHAAELAHGLAYWAARWQPYPEPAGTAGPASTDTQLALPPDLTPAQALAAVPRLADQSGGFRARFARLAALPAWPAAALAGGSPAEISAWLTELADATVFRYLDIAHGNPVMLVHSATAPTAILRSLPALDTELWAPSAAAAWDAAAALTAIYTPSGPADEPSPDGSGTMDEVFARAVAHGDEHAIKFADTAADVYERTGNPAATAAAVRAVTLIPLP